jgi:hypothetical protein
MIAIASHEKCSTASNYGSLERLILLWLQFQSIPSL